MISCSQENKNKCMSDRVCLVCCNSCLISCSLRCEIVERDMLRKGEKTLSANYRLFSKSLVKEVSPRKYATFTRKEILDLYHKRLSLYEMKGIINSFLSKVELDEPEKEKLAEYLGIRVEDFKTFEETLLSNENLIRCLELESEKIHKFWKQVKKNHKISCVTVLDTAFITLSYLGLKKDTDKITIAIS